MSSLPETSQLALRRDGWQLHVTLNRPDVRNAINEAMWSEIEDVFARIRDDRSIRAVILRGAGGYFCAGADLKERKSLAELSSGAGDGADPLVARSRKAGRLLMAIDRAPQIVIAAVEGGALGGGFGLVCVSDIAIALAEARFGLPEVTLGIPPAQILPYLVKRIGITHVRRLALTAARFDGTEAARLGVVHEAVGTSAALDERLAATLALIDRCGPSAIAATKALMQHIEAVDTEALVDHSAVLFAQAARSAEGIEGAAAFRERRAPAWASRP